MDKNTLEPHTGGRPDSAPSASNYQFWEFWLISSKEMLEKVKRCYSRSWINDAPHILVVTGDLDHAWERADGYNSLQTDLAIAMHQMVLAATNDVVLWIMLGYQFRSGYPAQSAWHKGICKSLWHHAPRLSARKLYKTYSNYA
ncbi:MAG: hypothetical protein U0Z17_02300 [Bacteroidales bacterium]